MADRLLRKRDIAEKLQTGEEAAMVILARYGVHPIDLGYGRNMGKRWLESAVDYALKTMHAASQPKTKTANARVKRPEAGVSLADMKIDDIMKLTSGASLH